MGVYIMRVWEYGVCNMGVWSIHYAPLCLKFGHLYNCTFGINKQSVGEHFPHLPLSVTNLASIHLWLYVSAMGVILGPMFH